MKKSESGIAVIETLLLIIILALISGTGYYVWHSKQSADQTYDKQAAVSTKAVPSSSDGSSQAQIEKAPTTKMMFSKLPKTLQAVALTEISKQVPQCVKDGRLVDDSGAFTDPAVLYAPVGSAIITIGCDGGSAGLFAKDSKDATWKFVAKTQDTFTCDDIFHNPVPKSLLELSAGGPGTAVCIDKNGKTLNYAQASSTYFF